MSGPKKGKDKFRDIGGIDQASKKIAKAGYVSRKVIDEKKYKDFAALAGVTRDTGGFGFKQNGFKLFRSAMLRRRKPGAERENLANAQVFNPNFKPGINNKSHGVPDIFGGPNTPENLVNEERSVNLQLHKRVENCMGKVFDQFAPQKPTPLTRRGSITMMEEFDTKDVPTRREYLVHTDGNGKPDRYDHYTVIPHRK
jgi:hypothetical protein